MHKLKIILVSLMLFLLSCSTNNIPNSVKITNKNIEFKFKDRNYDNVYIGTNIDNDWNIRPMIKKDSVWYIKLNNPHRNVEYKFLINNLFWKTDPLNNKKKKVPFPYKGYNSLLIIK